MAGAGEVLDSEWALQLNLWDDSDSPLLCPGLQTQEAVHFTRVHLSPPALELPPHHEMPGAWGPGVVG